VSIYIPNYNLAVVTIYRSPLGNFEIFIEILSTLLDKVKCNSTDVIVGGDFNVHFDHSNKYAEILCDLFKCYNMRPFVNFPTRGNVIIDNIFSNVTIDVKASDIALSDHTGLVVGFKINNKTTVSQNSRIIRGITPYGKLVFYNLLDKICWDFIDTDISPGNKCTLFLNNVTHNFNIAFPEKLIYSNSDGNRCRNSWFSYDLLVMRDKLRFLLDNCRLYKTDESKMMFDVQ
jgi:hypothetical protein